MPKIRVTMTHEYEPNSKDYKTNATIEEMMEIDKSNEAEQVFLDLGLFDVKFEIIKD